MICSVIMYSMMVCDNISYDMLCDNVSYDLVRDNVSYDNGV